MQKLFFFCALAATFNVSHAVALAPVAEFEDARLARADHSSRDEQVARLGKLAKAQRSAEKKNARSQLSMYRCIFSDVSDRVQS
jgi:hypothetical protein